MKDAVCMSIVHGKMVRNIVDCTRGCLSLNPPFRPTANAVLHHKRFGECIQFKAEKIICLKRGELVTFSFFLVQKIMTDYAINPLFRSEKEINSNLSIFIIFFNFSSYTTRLFSDFEIFRIKSYSSTRPNYGVDGKARHRGSLYNCKLENKHSPCEEMGQKENVCCHQSTSSHVSTFLKVQDSDGEPF